MTLINHLRLAPRMRSFVALAAAALLGLAVPSAARACSCASYGSPAEDARAILERSDGAFIGVLKSVRVIPREVPPGQGVGPDRAIFKYRVRQAFDARLGDFVKLRSTTDGGSCGLTTRRERRYALGISGRPGAWTAGSCSYMSPEALQTVAGERQGGSSPGRAGCGG